MRSCAWRVLRCCWSCVVVAIACWKNYSIIQVNKTGVVICVISGVIKSSFKDKGLLSSGTVHHPGPESCTSVFVVVSFGISVLVLFDIF